MTAPDPPERTATAAELAAERAKLDRAASGEWRAQREAAATLAATGLSRPQAELTGRVSGVTVVPGEADQPSAHVSFAPPAAEAAAYVLPGGERCRATSRTGPAYTCNAAEGHDGDHAAYGIHGENLCHTWPQETAPPSPLAALAASPAVTAARDILARLDAICAREGGPGDDQRPLSSALRAVLAEIDKAAR